MFFYYNILIIFRIILAFYCTYLLIFSHNINEYQIENANNDNMVMIEWYENKCRFFVFSIETNYSFGSNWFLAVNYLLAWYACSIFHSILQMFDVYDQISVETFVKWLRNRWTSQNDWNAKCKTKMDKRENEATIVMVWNDTFWYLLI